MVHNQNETFASNRANTEMVFCCVVGCSNRSEKCREKSFYRIPAAVSHHDKETHELPSKRRTAWFNGIKRADSDTTATFYRVCSDHFVNGKPSKLFESNHQDWTPSVNMGYNKKIESISRHSRRLNRNLEKDYTVDKKKCNLGEDSHSNTSELQEQVNLNESKVELINISDNEDYERSPINFENFSFSHVQTQTDVTTDLIDIKEKEFVNTNHMLYKLQKEISLLHPGTREWFASEEKVKFYTELPNIEILDALFVYISESITSSARSALTKYQMLSLALMQLRLNLTITDLAYRFNVSSSTASSVFLKIVDILFSHLKPVIKWPSREQIWKTTPMCFRKHFGTNIVVIVDCFGFFINKPKNILARAQTFSSYKYHNTVKFLIGITPRGVLSCISKAWGGCTSDKFLTENCDFLNNLVPGNIVMADRGFDIEESVALYYAKVKIPSFTKGKRQLNSLDVEQSRRIAAVRIYVERVIGNVRNKYSLLQSILPLDFLMKKDR